MYNVLLKNIQFICTIFRYVKKSESKISIRFFLRIECILTSHVRKPEMDQIQIFQ